jgi:hypothetical protein
MLIPKAKLDQVKELLNKNHEQLQEGRINPTPNSVPEGNELANNPWEGLLPEDE